MTGWWGRSIMGCVALLVLGAGCCVFDGGSHGGHAGNAGHHGETTHDLCLSMIGASLVGFLLVGPLVNGWVRPDAPRSSYAAALHLPDPPPKHASLVLAVS